MIFKNMCGLYACFLYVLIIFASVRGRVVLEENIIENTITDVETKTENDKYELPAMHKDHLVPTESPKLTSDKSINFHENEIEIDDVIDKNLIVETSTTVKTPHDVDLQKIVNEEGKILLKANETNPSSAETTTAARLLLIKNNTVDMNQTFNVRNNKPKEDEINALILTPFIENGDLKQARELSRVNPHLFLGIESYSGYLTVNKTYNSNLFFWYFPVENRLVNETPWIVWLQGGPGVSSMTGLFDEIGPFYLDEKNKLRKNSFSWLRNHSLVFIDNPVGTGFSFTDHPDGFVKDMDTYGKHLYTAVNQLVQIFPELSTAPLFVAGESYAGKYVPALGINIHRNKNISKTIINLKGLLLGNAYTSPKTISEMYLPFYHFGLLDTEELERIKPLIRSLSKDISANNSIQAKEKWNNLISVFVALTHQRHAYNFLRDDLPIGQFDDFLERSDVKRSLHVGNMDFSFINVTVNSVLASDFLSSTVPLLEELLDHYKVLAYCGQLDQMMPCPALSESYRTWRWKGTKQYKEAKRLPFFFNNRIAGYQKSGGGLTSVVVRGAGHMVPLDTPGAARALITAFTHELPPSQILQLIKGRFAKEHDKNTSIAIYL